MNNLASIINLIATAVSTRMTLTLSQRIQRMSADMNRSSSTGWFNRTQSSSTHRNRALERSDNRVESATRNYQESRSLADQATEDYRKEYLNPTGKNLNALSKVAEDYRKGMERAARVLAKLTRENERISTGQKTGWFGQTLAGSAINSRKLDASSTAVQSAKSVFESARGNALQAAGEYLRETIAPTGKDLAALGEAAENYRQKMDEASAVLDQVTRQNDQLRASMISQKMSDRTDRAYENGETATARHDRLQGQYSSIRDAVTQEELNPTGMPQDQLDHMRHAADVYQAQLDQASESLQRVTGEQDHLRQTINEQIRLKKDEISISEEDASSLDTALRRIDKAIGARDQAGATYDQRRDKLTNEHLFPTDRTPRELAIMAQSVEEARVRFESLSHSVERATKDFDTLKDKSVTRSSADASASERHGGSGLQKAWRQLRTRTRRAIGSRNRKSTNSAFNKIDAVINPQQARRRHGIARKNLSKARTARDAAYEANQLRSTPATVSALGEAESTVGAATKAVAATGAMAEFGEAIAAVGAVAGAVTGVVVGVGAAIAAAIAFINNRMAEGKKEIERFRSERSTFSASVSGAILRYDVQSKILEARSTQATAGSAVGVTQATMKLRESNQDRSEQWEIIANTILATSIDIATKVSNGLAALDIITPAANAALNYFRDWAEFWGIELTEIKKNTKKPVIENVGVEVFREFNRGNVAARAQKELPPLKPIK